MKRLLDMPASSPLLGQAQRLIEAAPPVDDSTEQMLRIRRALDQPAARGAILRAPAFALGGALVVFGASAFAAVRVWVEHRGSDTATAATEQRAAVPAELSMPEPLATGEQRTQPARPQPPAAEAPSVRAKHSEPAVVAAADPAPEVTPRARVKPSSKAARARRIRGRASRASSRQSRRAAVGIAAAAPVASVAPSLQLPEVASTEAEAIAAGPAPAVVRAQPEPDRLSQPSAAEAAPERVSQPRAAEAQADDEHEEVSEPAVSVSVVEKRSSDSELVVRAVRALRRDRDPEAASRLLERYRSRNPSGVLAEEVLSLQIEAALAAKDGRAAALAREYLSRYPTGRYRARAQSALSGPAP